jgi:hypothetical protein
MRCVGIAASWQVADDQDGIYLRAERDSLAELDGLREMVLQLPRSGKKDEGRELLLTAQPVLTRLIGAVDAHQKYNTDLGTQGSKAAEKTRREALIVSCTMGLVLLGVLLLSGSRTLGWLGGGVVSDAVAAMAGLAERCAGGGSGLGRPSRSARKRSCSIG